MCKNCGSQLPPEPPPNGQCPNCQCDYNVCAIDAGMQRGTPDSPGKQYNPLSTNNTMIIPQGIPIAANIVFDSKTNKLYVLSDKHRSLKKQIMEDIKEQKELPSEKTYKSEEFKQFTDPLDTRDINSDNSDIETSCFDLEIDG
jgi:hypothetical protein